MKNKQIIKISVFGLMFFSCSEKSSAQNIENKQENLPLTLQLKKWKETPVVNNRVADKNDVDSGNAIYYIEGESNDHKPFKIDLPKLGYWNDLEKNKKELVVIIQIEETPKGTVVGYRNFTGGMGAGLISEFEILNDKEAEKLVGN